MTRGRFVKQAAKVGDFEVALQVAAARACGARMIATRNASDYEGSPIPARSPAEVLAEL